MLRTTFTVSFMSLLLLGCSSGGMMDSSESGSISKWKTFDDAKLAYDQIKPHHTTVAQLNEMGFDPYQSPNIKRLTYLDVIERFVPNSNISLAYLDPSVRGCIQARESCYAYETEFKVGKRRNSGNLMLDMMNIQRKSVVTGWEFNALIVIKNDRVVYKLWNGKPNVIETESETNPMGFLKTTAGVVRKTVF